MASDETRETAETSQSAETNETAEKPHAVLVTGAGGYLGRLVVRALAQDRRGLAAIVAVDLKAPPAGDRLAGVDYVALDVRAPELAQVIRDHAVTTVVHLASAVAGRAMSREEQYDIDVRGTENVLEACLGAGATKVIVTSSGAAYGYYADNPPSLTEDHPLRGNEAFPYSHHKRLVEELLARYRESHPELRQLVFRPGTILGAGARGPIADFFEKPVIFGLKSAASPFVFAWDEDVAGCIVEGVHSAKTGCYNVAGDGVMTLREVAAAMGKPFVALPDTLLESALTLLERYGLTQYGPEQLLFLAYRPVLANDRLKREFGYRPRKTSREVFELYRQSKADRPAGGTGPLTAGTVFRSLLYRARSPAR